MVMRFLGKLQSFLYDSLSDLYIHQILDAFRFSQISLELGIRIGVREISYVACGFSPIKIHFSDYPKSLISRINEVYVSFNKISL